MAERVIDWAQMEAEYVNSTMSLRETAAKYGVPLGNVQKRSAKCKWSEKRKKYAEKKAQRVSDKLNDKDVKQTVRDIERVCKAAGKLIDAANRAIRQLDKAAYVSYDNIEQSVEESSDGGVATVKTVKKRKMRMAQEKTIIDTKRMADIAKTLQSIKEVLTGEDGRAEEAENCGVIEIAAANSLDERVESESES